MTDAPHLPYTDAQIRAMKPLISHDGDYIDWPWSDRAVARYLARGVNVRLAELEADPTIQQVLVVTHIPIFAEAVPDYPESETWSLLRATMGNFTLGELVRQRLKVTHVVSGHIHRAGQWQVPGAEGAIDFRLVGRREGDPALIVLDF